MVEDWAALLIGAAEHDLATRRALAATGALFDGYAPEMERVHIENALLLDRAFDAIGWPSRAKLGDEAAGAAMLILQHAISRPQTMRRGLDLLLEAAAAGEANTLDAAYLADRIAVLSGMPQRFGTQFDWDSAGLLSPAPIAEPGDIDARRASIGLPPMAETIAHMRANAAAEGQTKPADLEQRRRDYETWATRVGWRA